MTHESDGWLDAVAAASYLHTTQSAIHKQVQRGTLKAHRLGRRLRFRLRDLDAALLVHPASEVRRGRKAARSG